MERQAQASAAAALERFGRIDVLVNDAGRGLVSAVEEASEEEVRSVFAVNVEGPLTVTRAVQPSMRARRSGRILNVSSVGGFSVGAGWGIYGATKFAVEGISEALRAELLPVGIHVTIIEPGVFRTDFLDSSSLVHMAKHCRRLARVGGIHQSGASRRSGESRRRNPGNCHRRGSSATPATGGRLCCEVGSETGAGGFRTRAMADTSYVHGL